MMEFTLGKIPFLHLNYFHFQFGSLRMHNWTFNVLLIKMVFLRGFAQKNDRKAIPEY